MKANDSKQIYLRRMNQVIDPISDHLAEPLDLETLVRLAHFSPFHFYLTFRSFHVSNRTIAFPKIARFDKTSWPTQVTISEVSPTLRSRHLVARPRTRVVGRA